MEYESSASKRVAVDSDLAAVRIVIKAKKNFFLLPFLLVWLTGWTIGGLFAAGTLLLRSDPLNSEGLFVLVWLVGWAFGWVFAFSAITWMIRGRETIEIDAQAVHLRVAALIFRRERIFDPLKIRKLRRSERPRVWSMGGMDGFPTSANASLAFDYGTRTITFGAGLDPAEADAVVEAMSKRLGSRVLDA